jgi:hypothetical protein
MALQGIAQAIRAVLVLSAEDRQHSSHANAPQ